MQIDDRILDGHGSRRMPDSLPGLRGTRFSTWAFFERRFVVAENITQRTAKGSMLFDSSARFASN